MESKYTCVNFHISHFPKAGYFCLTCYRSWEPTLRQPCLHLHSAPYHPGPRPWSWDNILGWPKGFFSFYVKKNFSFLPRTLLNSVFTALFHYLLPLFSNFVIPSSQNLLSFWAKNCSRCLLQSSREWKFFLLREFCKDLNKWKTEGNMCGECIGWIRASQLSFNSFCLVIKKTRGLVVFWWKSMCFLSINSRHFSLMLL